MYPNRYGTDNSLISLFFRSSSSTYFFFRFYFLVAWPIAYYIRIIYLQYLDQTRKHKSIIKIRISGWIRILSTLPFYLFHFCLRWHRFNKAMFDNDDDNGDEDDNDDVFLIVAAASTEYHLCPQCCTKCYGFSFSNGQCFCKYWTRAARLHLNGNGISIHVHIIYKHFIPFIQTHSRSLSLSLFQSLDEWIVWTSTLTFEAGAQMARIHEIKHGLHGITYTKTIRMIQNQKLSELSVIGPFPY